MTDDELRRLVHDLRSPLAIVEGFAGLLDSVELDTAQRADYVARIRAAAVEMSERLDAVVR